MFSLTVLVSEDCCEMDKHYASEPNGSAVITRQVLPTRWAMLNREGETYTSPTHLRPV